MAKNFVALMNELRNSSTEKQKEKVSDEISDFLKTYEKYSSSFIVSIMRIIIITNSEPLFTECSKTEFYEYRIKAYIDDDGKVKFFFAISFLQPHDKYDSELDHRVAEIVQKELKNRNFEKIVNHISVNNLQFKNLKPLTINFE